MNIEFKYVESQDRPEEIDKTSSKYGVYIRRNIEEKTRKDDTESNIELIYYGYEEAYLSNEDYKLYQMELKAEEKETVMQLAIAELAERIMN